MTFRSDEKERTCKDCGAAFWSKYAKLRCPDCQHEEKKRLRRNWWQKSGKKRYIKAHVIDVDPKNDATFFETPEETTRRRAALHKRLFGREIGLDDRSRIATRK